MKKIALIAHLSEISGAGVALLETAVGLSEAYRVWLIVPAEGPLADRARQRGVDCLVISNPEVAIFGTRPARKLDILKARGNYIRQLKQFLRREKVDLAYVNSSASIFAGVAARLANVPIAWHIHETLGAADQRTQWKKRIISRLADALIYASQSGMDNFPPPKGIPAIIARNFISVADIAAKVHSERENPGSGNRNPLILCNGTFYRKGADVLLHAVQLLGQRSPHLAPHVEIVGAVNPADKFAEDLMKTAADPELAGRVTFTGLQPSLVASLARADVFVSASRNEALPISLVEAMAAGVPVIATDVGDCAALLDYGKCGWVVPPQTPVALAAALEEVLSDVELVNAKTRHAAEKVRATYHTDNFWDPIIKLIESIMKKNA